MLGLFTFSTLDPRLAGCLVAGCVGRDERGCNHRVCVECLVLAPLYRALYHRHLRPRGGALLLEGSACVVVTSSDRRGSRSAVPKRVVLS